MKALHRALVSCRLSKLAVAPFGHFSDVSPDQIYKPARKLDFKSGFAPVYKLSEGSLDMLKEKTKRMRMTFSLPTMAYFTLLVTHLPLTPFYLSGILVSEFIAFNLVKVQVKKLRSTIVKLEIYRNLEQFRITVVDHSSKVASFRSELFTPDNGFTNTFTKDEVESIVLDDRNNGKIFRTKVDNKRIFIIINKEGRRETLRLGLSSNELSGYNDYFEAMAEKKLIKF